VLEKSVKKAEDELFELKYQVYLRKVEQMNKAKTILKSNHAQMSRDHKTEFMRHLLSKE
jgi:hypothetical protein